MLAFLKKIFKSLDEASKRHEIKCDSCGHVMQGSPRLCEKCNNPVHLSRQV